MENEQFNLADITPENIKFLKQLNLAMFPVVYSEKIYRRVLENAEENRLSKMIVVSREKDLRYVAGVCCKIEEVESRRKIYIMTLGVRAFYRNKGLGSRLLRHVLDAAKSENFESVYLHIQTNNEEALGLYRKFGFVQKETKREYYKRIEPSDAYVLEKVICDSSAEEATVD